MNISPLECDEELTAVTAVNTIKLAVFDMDGTLLQRRTIFVFAEQKGFTDELLAIINKQMIPSYKKSIEIAQLLKGMQGSDLLRIFRSIPLQDHVEEVMKELQRRSITTAIVTNSYQFVADDLQARLGIDFAFANNLLIKNGIVTGELQIHNTELREEFNGCKIHSICKNCIVEQLAQELNVAPDEVLAIGDGYIDQCMIEKAGVGIAFNAPKSVQEHADVSTDDFHIILNYI